MARECPGEPAVAGRLRRGFPAAGAAAAAAAAAAADTAGADATAACCAPPELISGPPLPLPPSPTERPPAVAASAAQVESTHCTVTNPAALLRIYCQYKALQPAASGASPGPALPSLAPPRPEPGARYYCVASDSSEGQCCAVRCGEVQASAAAPAVSTAGGGGDSATRNATRRQHPSNAAAGRA
ncbi:60S ribosomal protein L22-like [Schistocerca americana]|uniref:60S ribosomal protein L22-like n=1 Tax=Schistocerca americana TaxID=7009 RepID=UPI001F4F9C83|nr:60S ribosomal protein L22-like [Schistocerca americana]